MTLNLQEVARAVGAGSHPPPLEVAGWSVDTRTQNPGDVYFALRGPNHDGHDFLPAAIEKGAAAVVVESGIRLRLVHPSEARTTTFEFLVPDTRSEERRVGKECRYRR